MDYRERIIVDPDILTGKPVVKGTRIAVAFVLRLLALGMEPGQILAEYPGLTLDDIHACLGYAEALVDGDVFFPTTPAA